MSGSTMTDTPKKPWMRKRPGETDEQYDWRIAHSCYNCGAVIVDSRALDAHEDECSRRGKRNDTPTAVPDKSVPELREKGIM
jgi:hypothetical protein